MDEIYREELKEIYNRLINKVRGSKNYSNLIKHKNNLVNFYNDKVI